MPDNWKAIESAPRTGETIMVFGQRERATRSGIALAQWQTCVWVTTDERCNRHQSWRETITPTHWQPLPPPPKESSDGK